jgi:long-chain acyl-CoA synthetase
MNTAALLARAALEFPDRPAVAIGGRTHLDFAGLARRVAAIAGELRGSLGAQRGDRIAVFASNRIEYVEVLFACWWADLVVVPINAKLHHKEVAHILSDSESRVVFTCPKLAPALAPALPAGVAAIEMGSPDYEHLTGGETRPIAASEPDALAWLFYTSGTTGFPKGAMISHANLMALVSGYAADVDGIEPGDALIHAAGGVQVIPPSGAFDEAELFELIAAHPRASLFAAPTIVKRMTRHARANRSDHHNLRTVVYGGGPLYYEDLVEASGHFGDCFAQIYGQGECPMTITSMRRGAFTAAVARRDGDYLRSVGMPFSFNDVRIKDAEGMDLPEGAVGEICVRSPAVCLGYWNNPEATAKTFRGGWLYTGDLGRFAENGALVLAGRSKEMIISGGSNIYPIEVEDVLLSHPEVVEAAVIGIPDGEWGEAVVAYIVAPGTDAGFVKRLDAYCVEHMARFKRPKHYRVVNELPKNNYGKVVKRDLVAMET